MSERCRDERIRTVISDIVDHTPLILNERRDSLGSFLFVGLTAGLAWAPFWLGGNRPIAWGVNGVVFPALALVHEAAVLLGRRNHAVALKQIAAPAALFFLVVVWIGAQCIAMPVSYWFAHPIWTVAANSLEAQVSGSISVNRAETGIALLRLVTDASVFWISLQLCRAPARAFSLLWAIACIVSFYAIGGLLLAAFFDNAIPLIDAPPPQGGLRATFVNRNHFSTYAGLGLVVSVGLALHRLNHEVIDDWRFYFRAFARVSAPIGLSLVILAALVATTSRGGVFSTAVALVALLGMNARRVSPRALEGLAAVTLMLAIAFMLVSDSLFARVSEVGLDGAARLSTYRIVVGSIIDNPLTGLGYGAFIDAFPLYRDQSIPTVGLWDKAHNTYLEALNGLGVIFGIALIAAVFLLVIKCLNGVRRRRRDVTPPAVATAAAVLVGVHALVDFSLQIEAVALTFMALLGAGVAQSESSRISVGD